MAAPSVTNLSDFSKKKVISAGKDQGLDIKKSDVTPAAMEKIAADPTPQAEKTAAIEAKPKKDSNDKIYLALAAALPTIIGAAFGGAEGGALGAKTTADMAGTYMKSLADKEKDARDQEQKIELAKIAAGAKASEGELARQNRLETAQIMAGTTNAFRQERRADRQDEIDRKIAEKEELLQVPGLGRAMTADDAKQVKSGLEMKKGFDRKIQELIDLREAKGGGAVLDREAVKRATQLSKDLLLAYKDMAKLGVLSVSDENILNAIIPPDPLEFRTPLEAIQGQDPILNNLKKFKEDAEADFQTKLSTRIKGYKPQPQSSFEPDVMKYAETHGITPEAAQAIKLKRSGQ